MSGYRLFDVTSEVLIDRRRGAFRQQSDAFLDGSARRGRRVQHGYGQRTILDGRPQYQLALGPAARRSRAWSRLPRYGLWPYAYGCFFHGAGPILFFRASSGLVTDSGPSIPGHWPTFRY
jgi:hypothetical protein